MKSSLGRKGKEDFYWIEEAVLRKGAEKYLGRLQDKGLGVGSEIAAEENSAQMVSNIIGALKSLIVSRRDKSELEDAIEHMERVQRRGEVTEKDVEKNIDDLLEAIESLISITSVDVTEIRLMMDVLLEVWIGRLTLFLSS